MKKITSLFLSFFLMSLAVGQTVYQSPHVYDGKTIEFTTPAGLFEVVGAGYIGGATFVSVENMDVNLLEEGKTSVLEFGHEPLNGESLEYFKNGLIEEVKGQDGITVIDAPKVIPVNGKECLFAAYREEDGDGYISATIFGDYLISIIYFTSKDDSKALSFEKFKKIIGSWKIVETDKEDGFNYDEFETNYQNDYFETELSYFDILPDFGEEWNETLEENSHLLCEFCFKGEQGFIRVFSGGSAFEYNSPTDMSEAIQKVFDKPTSLTLSYTSKFENMDHEFSYYTINGGGELVGVYTTVVSNELVFLVIDKGSSPASDFIPESKIFMQEMLIIGNE